MSGFPLLSSDDLFIHLRPTMCQVRSGCRSIDVKEGSMPDYKDMENRQWLISVLKMLKS